MGGRHIPSRCPASVSPLCSEGACLDHPRALFHSPRHRSEAPSEPGWRLESRLSSPTDPLPLCPRPLPHDLFLVLGLTYLSEPLCCILGKGPPSQPTLPGCARGQATQVKLGGDPLPCPDRLTPPLPSQRLASPCWRSPTPARVCASVMSGCQENVGCPGPLGSRNHQNSALILTRQSWGDAGEGHSDFMVR